MRRLSVLSGLVILTLAWLSPGSDTSAWGQPRADFFRSQVGRAKVNASLTGAFFGKADLDQEGTDLEQSHVSLKISAPLAQTDRQEWLAYLGAKFDRYDTEAVLPDSGLAFPEDLWDLRLGSAYRRQLDNGWITGLDLSLGSASDRPFTSSDKIFFHGLGLLRVPRGERNAWLFMLQFSTNREFLNYVPLPGVGYYYEPSKAFRAVIGFPFAFFRWRPVERLSLQASYFPLTNIEALVSYKITPTMVAFGGFSWDNRRFELDGRADTDDLFFAFEKRIQAGIRFPLFKGPALVLMGGYSFDRFFFQGQGRDDDDQDRVEADPAWFVSLMVAIRF